MRVMLDIVHSNSHVDCSILRHCGVCSRDHDYALECECGHGFGDHGALHYGSPCTICHCVRFDHEVE